VTQSTVSLVLSGKAAGRVSTALQASVRQAAAELGYEPLESARALRSGRTDAIGLVVPDITNPFLGLVMHGAQQAAGDAGFAAVLMESGRGAADHRRAVQALRGGLVGGLLLFGIAPERGADLQGTVLIEVQRRGTPSVVLDSDAGMTAAVDLLVRTGHRALGYLGISDRRWSFERRQRQLSDAVQRHPGLRPPVVALADDLTIAAGAAAAAPMLRRRRRPTAVVCADDILAAGLYAAAADAGLAIPGDLSVVSYAGTIVGDALVPKVTTVRAPAAELGGRAARLLLDRLAGAPVPERTVVPVTLSERGSVCPPAQPGAAGGA
jgi:LacI family repressor for deo operon, udp, cdd, tsx, nupC, and nupG